ncbi:MAG: penicillin-binding transpeptidase domain-containing protein [Acidobacteria bacterium]|nr:penicillin-binding transpeptidase domain-containing protein [Acidobacteriota bacterium]
MSQLNRALAKRQPGSSFKPFVYAAALNTALEGGSKVFTPISTIVDEPTTFWYDGKPYEPSNFKDEYRGTVTLRQAIAKSMNVPTVKLAESVGYEAVVELARNAGMNLHIKPTPALALGAYEVTPIEIAGAYTIYPNRGVYLKPHWIKIIRAEAGKTIFTSKTESRPVLDPRVAYMMVNMMEEVLRSGTGAGVRAQGFLLPAAGKTGTSHDGWFAGFTSKLICVVWVGFDDNRELNLEGAHSALPIWTEFMKRAHQYREYRGVREFAAPDGVVSVQIDPATGQLASPNCPGVRSEVFIAGTQPVEVCHLHGGGRSSSTLVAGWDAGAPPADAATASAGTSDKAKAAVHARGRSRKPPESPPMQAQAPPPPAKRSIFRRLLDVFK